MCGGNTCKTQPAPDLQNAFPLQIGFFQTPPRKLDGGTPYVRPVGQTLIPRKHLRKDGLKENVRVADLENSEGRCADLHIMQSEIEARGKPTTQGFRIGRDGTEIRRDGHTISKGNHETHLEDDPVCVDA